MEKRIKRIYNELYSGVKKKNHLAELFDVTTKTIDNSISKYSNDIVMDRELGGYRFASLLPSKIPSNVFFQFFQDSIDNHIIKDDFITLAKIIATKEDLELPMIPTSVLSSFAKKIIMINVAINTNCELKIEYIGNRGGESEIKYIKPHSVFVSNSKYYLYVSYIDENQKNVGEYRSFAFNGIIDIEPFKYLKNENFREEHTFNSYGPIRKDNYVTLNLRLTAANYFKKEGYFSKPDYDFIREEVDGTVVCKMYYNNIQQIVSLVQQWMPFITVNGDMSEDIHKKVRDNCKILLFN